MEARGAVTSLTAPAPRPLLVPTQGKSVAVTLDNSL
jgi:hypothetical protein